MLQMTGAWAYAKKKRRRNMARNEQQFIVIRNSKILFIGTARECADIVGLEFTGHVHQYAKRFHCYHGYYFVKLPDGIINKQADDIHSSMASAASARAHMMIVQSRLERAIADSDHDTVDTIDRYLSLMLKSDRLKEFMERKGYKMHEYD